MKKQLVMALVPALVLLASFPAWGSDGDILMLASLSGTTEKTGYECGFWKITWNNGKGNQPFGACQAPVITMYGELKGASAGGITGVEFAVGYDGGLLPPPGYFFLPIPIHGAGTSLGNPFFGGGNLTWDTCQTGNLAGRVPLFNILVISTNPCGPSQQPPQMELSGIGHTSPSNPFFRCPLFTLCDAPAYTKVCLGDNLEMCVRQQPPFPTDATCSTSGSFMINDNQGVGACNPPPGKTAASSTIATSETWSGMKALYR